MGDKAPQIAYLFSHSDIYRLGGEKPAQPLDAILLSIKARTQYSRGGGNHDEEATHINPHGSIDRHICLRISEPDLGIRLEAGRNRLVV